MSRKTFRTAVVTLIVVGVVAVWAGRHQAGKPHPAQPAPSHSAVRR